LIVIEESAFMMLSVIAQYEIIHFYLFLFFAIFSVVLSNKKNNKKSIEIQPLVFLYIALMSLRSCSDSNGGIWNWF
jgi:hypothetical protein